MVCPGMNCTGSVVAQALESMTIFSLSSDALAFLCLDASKEDCGLIPVRLVQAKLGIVVIGRRQHWYV